MCVQNLKFVALPIPEIIGGTQKMGSPWIRSRFLSQKFLIHRVHPNIIMYLPNLKFVALPIPEAEIIATEVLGMRTPNLGEEEAVGSRRW